MKFTVAMGLVLIVFSALVVSSPYWLLREFLRPGDESLPEWMGDARARKRRLIVIMGVLGAVGGVVLVVFSVLNP